MPQASEAEALIQRAYNISIGTDHGPIEEVLELLQHVDLKTLHHVMYDSQLFSHPEIQAELREHRNGAYAIFIRAFIDSCVQFRLYSRKVLEDIYLPK
jgi:hypothetical protein